FFQAEDGIRCRNVTGVQTCALPIYPLVRKPGSDKWEPISWDDALDKIANKVKEVREDTFVETDEIDGEEVTVNRMDGIFSLGSAEIDNEEAYLYTKFNRAIGVHNYSHQAEI